MKNVYLPFILCRENKKDCKKPQRKGEKNAPKKNVKKPKGNDFSSLLDFGIRDIFPDSSVLDLGVQGGQIMVQQISFAPNILYNINKSLNARLFFDYREEYSL